ncbi:OmpH family outer membrane protein [Pacificoceanicola onchidii]|uniref:OmpH family outer membrane protein n=1 Tax=Pacificoceanicola onchidii TaxID=2562685 RepID=UPI0010A5C707|nr:OmpH family outer membrane protein [Pacificoceanicola onchidii]
MIRLLACLVLGIWPLAGSAQQLGGPLSTGVVESTVLVVSLDRVFTESAFGRRTIVEIESATAELAAENRRIEAELAEEERLLTEQRPSLAVEDFRTLANAFDTKVQRMRDEQDAKARAVSARPEEARRRMIQVVQPILREILLDSGAAVILERRAVIDALPDVDVTALVIERMNDRIGDGSALETAPEDDQ